MMLEDKWAEKRDRWVWSIFLESNGVWWWIMKMGRVIVKRLLVIKGDAVHCVDRPSHERISSFVACNKVLLHWSLKSPGDSWKIQVRPPESRKLKFGPGLRVLIQHYTQSLFNHATLKETGYIYIHLYGLLPFFFFNVNTSYMLCPTIGDWYILYGMLLSLDVIVTVLSTILVYLQLRNQK